MFITRWELPTHNYWQCVYYSLEHYLHVSQSECHYGSGYVSSYIPQRTPSVKKKMIYYKRLVLLIRGTNLLLVTQLILGFQKIRGTHQYNTETCLQDDWHTRAAVWVCICVCVHVCLYAHVHVCLCVCVFCVPIQTVKH